MYFTPPVSYLNFAFMYDYYWYLQKKKEGDSEGNLFPYFLAVITLMRLKIKIKNTIKTCLCSNEQVCTI